MQRAARTQCDSGFTLPFWLRCWRPNARRMARRSGPRHRLQTSRQEASALSSPAPPPPPNAGSLPLPPPGPLCQQAAVLDAVQQSAARLYAEHMLAAPQERPRVRVWIDEHAFAEGETELLRQALQVITTPNFGIKPSRRIVQAPTSSGPMLTGTHRIQHICGHTAEAGLFTGTPISAHR